MERVSRNSKKILASLSHKTVTDSYTPGCWFTSDKTRLLVNFLPRWIIIGLMLLLYLRLHFIIHRAHDNFVSFNDEEEYGAGSGSYSASKSGGTWSQQPVHLSKLSEGSSQERIVAPSSPPAPVPRPKVRKSRGAADLRRVSFEKSSRHEQATKF